MADKIIKVLLVDDHQVVRRGLRTFLEIQDDIEVVGEASDGAEGVARTEELRPDVVLMDIKMPGTDGIEALRRLRELENPAKVLIVTSFTEQRTVACPAGGSIGLRVQGRRPGRPGRCHPLGPRGPCPAPARGRRSAAGPGRHGQRHGAGSTLTEREREVLGLIADGRSNREIARALVLSEKTVKTHVSNILMKLDLSDRTQAALWAVRHGAAG